MLTFHLRKQLRDFEVEVSQTIASETLVLIGHSGCGKSTTLQMLAGLVTPDRGSIELNGRVLFDAERQVEILPESRHIGYVFQNYALFPHLSVVENIAYGLSGLSEADIHERIDEALELLGLKKLVDAKPAMLSGGEQQRVALARAIVTRPSLLLLDEPLSALDISTRSRVRSELKELLRTLAIPSIVVTHDFEDARVLGDNIAVMDRGRIIQYGEPKEIALLPVNDFVAEFTGTNLLPAGSSYVAFDSWNTQVSSQPTSAPYEWKGQIRDIASIGGFVRLHLEGISQFQADVSLDQFEAEAYKMGQQVYVSALPEQVRLLPDDPGVVRIRPKQKINDGTGYKSVRSKRGKRKWMVAAIVAALSVTSVVTGYAISSKDAGSPDQKKMTVFIAANGAEPTKDLMKVFESLHSDVKIEMTTAGTQVLRAQLEHGAKADFFLSADLYHIQAMKEEGLVAEYVPVANNHEVIVVPKSNPGNVHSIQDLANRPIKLVIGTDSVPIGKYTRQIFKNVDEKLDPTFSSKVISRVVSFETDTKLVLQKVAMGEAQAGIVYRTDVNKSFVDKVDIVKIPSEYNVQATHYIAVPIEAPYRELGNEFLNLMLSPQGQAVFKSYSYDPLK